MQTIRDNFKHYVKKDEFSEEKRELSYSIKKLEETSAKKEDVDDANKDHEYM